MNNVFWLAIVSTLFLGLLFVLLQKNDDVPVDEPTLDVEEMIIEPETVPADLQAHIDSKADLIKLTNPQPLQVIDSPLTVTGLARGYWYFEASFPVMLVNWDGLIIAEGVAQAQGDWMTEDFVPFTAELTFESPYTIGDADFMRRGSIILQKDNPSGLPEHDDALEVPIAFIPKARPANVIIPDATSALSIEVYGGIEIPNTATTLDLSGRDLPGSLKAEIRHLTELTEINLSDNNFTGLPAEIGQLSKLEVLNLSNNPLTGLPQEIGNLSKLRTLDLRGTNYSEVDLNIIKQSLNSTTQILVD